MSNNLKSALAFTCFSVICYPLSAQKLNAPIPWYLGMGLGNTEYELTTLDTINTSDGPLPWELYTGWQVGKHLAVELGFKELGNHKFNQIESKRFTVSVLGSMPINNTWSIIGEIGIADEFSSLGKPKGQSPFLGIGVNFDITTKASLQAIYRRYENLRLPNTLNESIGSNYWGIKINYLLNTSK